MPYCNCCGAEVINGKCKHDKECHYHDMEIAKFLKIKEETKQAQREDLKRHAEINKQLGFNIGFTSC